MPKVLSVNVEEMVPEFVQLAKRGRYGLVMQHTYNALEYIATQYQEAWIKAAEGAGFEGLPFVINSTQYQRTIQRRQISPTLWEVYSDYTTKSGRGVTDLLERGHGLIDLKPGLLRGPKSKMGKNGRYNIVAFRQGTPGSDPHRSNPMPISVYKDFRTQMRQADAQKKAGSRQTGGASYTSKSSADQRKSTTWGSRYDPSSQRERLTKTIKKKGKTVGQYQWKSGKYAGMVGTQQSTTRAKRTGYMTFRVVSSGSDPMSWILPEQPPWPVRQAVINFMRPFAEAILQQALEADIK